MKTIAIQIPDWYDESDVKVLLTAPFKPVTKTDQERYLRSMAKDRERLFIKEAKAKYMSVLNRIHRNGLHNELFHSAWIVGMQKTGNHVPTHHQYQWSKEIDRLRYDEVLSDERMMYFVAEFDRIEAAANQFLKSVVTIIDFELSQDYGV